MQLSPATTKWTKYQMCVLDVDTKFQQRIENLKKSKIGLGFRLQKNLIKTFLNLLFAS